MPHPLDPRSPCVSDRLAGPRVLVYGLGLAVAWVLLGGVLWFVLR